MKALFPDLIVNGETVPQEQVAAEVQNHDAPQGKPGIAWRKAANAIAVRTLLLQKARANGEISRPAPVGPGLVETDEEAQIRGLLETEVMVDAPTDDAIKAEWLRDPKRFRSPPLWEVSHILFACDPRDATAKEAALLRANAVLETAQKSARPFAKLAEEHSDCGSKSSGGALGQVGPGETVPEFEAALKGMAESEVSSTPVLTRHGWHIIRMDAVAEGRVLPFDAVKQHISDAMEKAAWTKAARDFTDDLVRSASISGANLNTDRSDAA